MNGTSKHWLIVGVVFALGFTTAWIVRDGSPRPARAGQPPRPGDLNGDDIVDVSDPVYLLVHLFRGGPPPVAAEPTVGPVSTVVIVRHAERETNGEDPGLTPEGQLRAERLAAILGPTAVDTLIASTLRRTRETLAPLAGVKGLPILEIMDETEVAKRVANQPQGSMTVVAHHSFTIHDILEGLGISDSRSTIDVSGSNYDNFLMLLRPTAGDPQLVHMTY